MNNISPFNSTSSTSDASRDAAWPVAEAWEQFSRLQDIAPQAYHARYEDAWYLLCDDLASGEYSERAWKSLLTITLPLSLAA